MLLSLCPIKSFGRRSISQLSWEKGLSLTLEPQLQSRPLGGPVGRLVVRSERTPGDRETRERVGPQGPPALHHPRIDSSKVCSKLALNPRGPSFLLNGLGSRCSSLELEESQPIPVAAFGHPVILGLNIIKIQQYDSFLVP